MVHHIVKKLKKKNYHYLADNVKVNKKWKKIKIYLGSGDLTKKELDKLIKKKTPLLEKKIDSYLRSVDPIYSLLSPEELKELDVIKRDYSKAIKKEEVVDYPSFEESFITEFTYDSNAIEGSTLSLKEVSLLLYDNIVPKGKNLREIHEAENHKASFEFVQQYQGDVSKKFILETHAKLMSNLLKKGAGEIRDVQVIIRGAGFMPPSAWEVEKQLNELIKWYKTNKKKYNPVILAAYTHVAFESIHPFRDGNGRTGRLLLNFILMKYKYPLINIKNKDRGRYIAALESGRIGNLRPFVNLILKYIRENKIVELIENEKLGTQQEKKSKKRTT